MPLIDFESLVELQAFYLSWILDFDVNKLVLSIKLDTPDEI
jgi:hypothetical protein